MDINVYNETIGEIYFNVEDFNNQLLLKMSGESKLLSNFIEKHQKINVNKSILK